MNKILTQIRDLNVAIREAGIYHQNALELRDDTAVPQDVWARLEEETLTGLFLRELHQRLDAETDPNARRTLQLALRYGLAALEGREAPR